MADILTFTPQPIRVTSTGAVQPLQTAIDVLSYDFLDVEIGLIGFEGSVAAPGAGIGITTGLQNECEDGWVITALQGFGAVNQFKTVSLTGQFLRYARWIVTASGWGTQTAAEFFIRGIGRRRGEP